MCIKSIVQINVTFVLKHLLPKEILGNIKRNISERNNDTVTGVEAEVVFKEGTGTHFSDFAADLL